MNKKRYFLLFIPILILGLLTANHFLGKGSEKLPYPSFVTALEENQVEEVILTEKNQNFKAILKNQPDIIYQVPHPQSETFTEELLLKGVSLDYSTGNSPIIGILSIGIIIGIIIYSRKSSSNGPSMKDASKKSKSHPSLRLDQVAGNAEAKLMVEDIIQFIKEPEHYMEVGARMPRGLLFYGPPGTGKTLMAKAIAGEANVPFYAMSGSDFVQMYVGVGASRIRSLFQKAKKSEKAVIFIDEIDAIGKKRARSVSASNDERDQTLNALLTEMSGFHDNSGIIVIAATNRLDTLDEALLRPGRFDRQIEIGLPDINAREKILSLYTKKKPISDEIDLKELAKATVSFSGAMLENFINEAAISAANEKMSVITKSHLDTAFYTVIAGAPKMDRSYITQKEREITAYHEAGHALATTLLLPDHVISKVTIIPSVRGAGGFNLTIPKDTMFQTKAQLRASIQVLLAGRIAEELIFGSEDITTGASNDIQRASSLIVDFLNKYGMDEELGLFSTQVLQEVQDEIFLVKCRTLMNELYKETKDMVQNNIGLLTNITSELLDRETLEEVDIQRLKEEYAA